MFFQVDQITLKTPHTAGISFKIIFRAILVIGASLRWLEGENQVKNWHSYHVWTQDYQMISRTSG